MITIQVTGYNGKPVSQSICADFDETGGTIGRSPENTLVLLDPERKISRTHASLARAPGGYVLQDRGSIVPVVLNGVPLGKGREAPIAAGDEIRIGGYVMSVRSANTAELETAKAQDGGGARGASQQAKALVVPKEPPPRVPDSAVTAPIAAQTVAEAAPAPIVPVEPPAPVEIEPMRAEFAADEQTITQSVAGPATTGPAATEPPAIAPLSTSLAATEPPATAPPSTALTATQPPATEPPSTSPAAESDADMSEPVLSWTGNEAAAVEGITTVVLSPTGHAFSEAQTTHPDAPPVWPAAHSMPSAPNADSPVAATVGSQPSATPRAASPNEDLIRALLAGAGVRDIDIPGGLSPQLMNQLGRVLREATGGLLDLLAARAMTKREVRADMTVIVASDNNPLKFSPDREAALTHLLVPRGRGFMPPLRAVADAYDDLRAHQLGFMAGMRSALAVVLARFDPRVLEERLSGTTVVDSFLPTHRKAKLWDLFGELYGTISSDAQNDFHILFGREFLRAYQAHVAKPPLRGDSPTNH